MATRILKVVSAELLTLPPLEGDRVLLFALDAAHVHLTNTTATVVRVDGNAYTVQPAGTTPELVLDTASMRVLVDDVPGTTLVGVLTGTPERDGPAQGTAHDASLRLLEAINSDDDFEAALTDFGTRVETFFTEEQVLELLAAARCVYTSTRPIHDEERAREAAICDVLGRMIQLQHAIYPVERQTEDAYNCFLSAAPNPEIDEGRVKQILHERLELLVGGGEASGDEPLEPDVATAAAEEDGAQDDGDTEISGVLDKSYTALLRAWATALADAPYPPGASSSSAAPPTTMLEALELLGVDLVNVLENEWPETAAKSDPCRTFARGFARLVDLLDEVYCSSFPSMEQRRTPLQVGVLRVLQAHGFDARACREGALLPAELQERWHTPMLPSSPSIVGGTLPAVLYFAIAHLQMQPALADGQDNPRRLSPTQRAIVAAGVHKSRGDDVGARPPWAHPHQLLCSTASLAFHHTGRVRLRRRRALPRRARGLQPS